MSSRGSFQAKKYAAAVIRSKIAIAMGKRLFPQPTVLTGCALRCMISRNAASARKVQTNLALSFPVLTKRFGLRSHEVIVSSPNTLFPDMLTDSPLVDVRGRP